MKLRLVNGAHSALAALGLPRGHATVADAVADPELLGLRAPPARRGARPDRAGRAGDRPRRVRRADARALRQPAHGARLAQIAAGAEHKIPQRFGRPPRAARPRPRAGADRTTSSRRPVILGRRPGARGLAGPADQRRLRGRRGRAVDRGHAANRRGGDRGERPGRRDALATADGTHGRLRPRARARRGDRRGRAHLRRPASWAAEPAAPSSTPPRPAHARTAPRR